ncbi:MAG: hypothetical protein ONB48_00890 [candidate division KSB1 bacterium]|nr:hypothetical protein [candidate division KSB1 bacterium]MDZ7272767.1 hypothetical protein [candidate division KSB1 bacterium]MDZ7284209.1 hypothetical protein [candidate division KSB1 bacterium]MDZ7297393.1 hypothetical protein [candidate division KSB1 bacterium]MDZ7306547.1 hypothetical protein [candidate division KSB1 bacterium]
MLVTFSGIVGSGKSTNAKRAMRVMQELGFTPYYLRFRFVGWRDLFRSPVQQPWAPRAELKSATSNLPAMNGQAKRRLEVDKRMNLMVVLGYLLHILRFRLFLSLYHRQHLVVLNRYFYDNFAHYRITTPAERRYLRFLLTAMPQPDLAFLMVTHPDTAFYRRPEYHREELQKISENYAQMRQLDSRLTVIATDNVSTVDSQIERSIRAVFHQMQMRPHEERIAS